MDDNVTGTMYLDSNELERQPAGTFLTKWTFNNKSCGTGKTKKDCDNIKYYVKKVLSRFYEPFDLRCFKSPVRSLNQNLKVSLISFTFFSNIGDLFN